MAVARHPADLSPLIRNCLFRSDERVDSHQQVARELAEHVLKWRRGSVDTAMFKGNLNRLQVYLLRYGAEVEVTPRPFEDFVLVHTSLRGGAEIECDGVRLNVAEGRAAVVAPRHKIQLRWLPGTDHLIVKVPFALIRDAGGHAEGDAPPLAPGFMVPRILGPQWDLLVQSVLNIMSMPPESNLSPTGVDHFERSVAQFLIQHQPPLIDGADASSPALGFKPDDGLTHSDGARRMEAILEYMDSRLSAPVSLFDLARAGNVSVRTLNELCHRYHGMSPMELLRNQRLDAVRSRLLLQPDANITEVAMNLGFGNMGRF